MKKQKKLSVLSDRDDAELNKLAKKQRSIAVSGNPDQTDLFNLNDLFSLYEKHTGGRIQRMKRDYDLQMALKEQTPMPKGKLGTDLKMVMWMPDDLQEFMKMYYPSIFTNEKHRDWFLRHYPVFKA